MKRIVSAILSLVMIFVCAFPVVAVSPRERLITLAGPEPVNYESAESDALEDLNVNLRDFDEYIAEQMASCPDSIDISAYKIPYANIDDLYKYIWYYVPGCFNFNTAEVMIYGTSADDPDAYITSLNNIQYYTFADTAKEYSEAWAAIGAAADKLTAGIKDNAGLSEVEKALLLHDRLAAWNEYEMTMSLEPDHSIYGALALRTSVCEGYAKAYIYLLDLVGMRADFCSSETLMHVWNIVYINDVPYHVDVTHDDPAYDVSGRATHKYFLLSSDELMTTRQSDANDFDLSPTSVAYDNAIWRENIWSAVQLIGDDIYCIDMKNAKLGILDANAGTITDVLQINDKWIVNDGQHYYNDCYSTLASDGTDLFYSTSTTVYKYDPATAESTAVFTPEQTQDYYQIYGLDYDNGYIITESYDSPLFAADTKASNQQTFLYAEPTQDPQDPPYDCSVSGHKWDEGTITTSPTCTAEGIKTLTCTECGETTTETIIAAGHSYGTVKSEATFTTDGLITKTCAECGDVVETEIPRASKITASATSFTYNGKVQKPTVTVKDKNGNAISKSYYTITYSNSSSKAAGSYTVKVTFKGNYSGTKTFTYKILPRQVSGLKVSTFNTISLKLTWTKLAEAKYYKVEYSTDGKTWKTASTVSTNSATVKNLKAGTKYQFRVTALDSTKKVAGKASAVLKTGTLCAKPAISSLKSAKAGQATATWGKVTGASKYIVYKSTDNKKWTKVTTTTKTSYTLTGLTKGKKIYVKIVAVNAYSKNSPDSAVKSVTGKK